MTQFPNDDQELVNFLRQNRPQVPPTSLNLEQQILQQLSPHQRLRLWLLPPILAAGFVAAIFSYRLLVPTQSNDAELATLQVFIENNWQSTVSESPESDVWNSTDSVTN